jgi:hypothetical protein
LADANHPILAFTTDLGQSVDDGADAEWVEANGMIEASAKRLGTSLSMSD